MENISATGLEVIIRASNTFPAGFTVTEFADDADPLDGPNIDIGDSAMGVNGDLVVWNTPQPLEVTLNVIPGTEADRALEILAEANRVAKNKSFARDIITMTFYYPVPGKRFTLINGHIRSIPPVYSAASAGRIKSRTYSFRFENKSA